MNKIVYRPQVSSNSFGTDADDESSYTEAEDHSEWATGTPPDGAPSYSTHADTPASMRAQLVEEAVTDRRAPSMENAATAYRPVPGRAAQPVEQRPAKGAK